MPGNCTLNCWYYLGLPRTEPRGSHLRHCHSLPSPTSAGPWPPAPVRPRHTSGRSASLQQHGARLLELSASLNCGIYFTPFPVHGCLTGAISPSIPWQGWMSLCIFDALVPVLGPQEMHRKRMWLTPMPLLMQCPLSRVPSPLLSWLTPFLAKPPTKQPILVDEKEVPFTRCFLHSGTWWAGLVPKSDLGTRAKVMQNQLLSPF